MIIKEKLQIIVITYNREKFIKKTLEFLLADNSPVKDFSILVLDNNSKDGTRQLIKDIQVLHSNVSYCKNNYNLGIGGNIARAMELANMEYVWLLADDDAINWQGWESLQEAVSSGKEVICAANYTIRPGKEKQPAALLQQMTFVSCNIYKTSLFNDTTMANIVNNIYTLFPHLVPAIEHINKGGEIYLLPQPLVSNDMKPDTDCSYIRGYNNTELYLKQRSMSWITGYANIIAQIKDKNLRYAIMQAPIGNEIHDSWSNFYSAMYNWYFKEGNWLPLFETARQLPWRKRLCLFLYLLSPVKFYHGKNGIYVNLFGKIKTKVWSGNNKRA